MPERQWAAAIAPSLGDGNYRFECGKRGVTREAEEVLESAALQERLDVAAPAVSRAIDPVKLTRRVDEVGRIVDHIAVAVEGLGLVGGSHDRVG